MNSLHVINYNNIFLVSIAFPLVAMIVILFKVKKLVTKIVMIVLSLLFALVTFISSVSLVFSNFFGGNIIILQLVFMPVTLVLLKKVLSNTLSLIKFMFVVLIVITYVAFVFYV